MRRAWVAVALCALFAAAAAVGFADEDTLHSQVFSFAVEHVHGDSVLQGVFTVDITDQMAVEVDDVPQVFGLSQVNIVATLTSGGVVRNVGVGVELFIQLDEWPATAVSPLMHHVVIQARIVEVDGKQVHTIEVLQQSVDIHQAGAVVREEFTTITVTESDFVPRPPHSHGGASGSHGHPHPHHGGKPDHEGKPHGWRKCPRHRNGQHSGDCDNAAGRQPGRPEDFMVTDPMPPGMDYQPAPPTHKSFCAKVHAFVRDAMAWLHTSHFVVQVLVAFTFGIATGIVLAVVLRFLAFVLTCGRVPFCPRRAPACDKAAHANNYALNLTAHAGAYTALPQDDKDVKKEPADAAV